MRLPDGAADRMELKAIELGSDDIVSVIFALLRGNVGYAHIS